MARILSRLLAELINSDTYSFSSALRISSIFLSSFLVSKNKCNTVIVLHLVRFFCEVRALFSCSEIKLSTETASVNHAAILIFKLI
jgi:hypothetical protein